MLSQSGGKALGCPSVALMTNLSHCKRAPKWTLQGRQDNSRARQLNAELPGPGHYYHRDDLIQSGYNKMESNFGCALRDHEPADKVPGPADYEPQKPKSCPSYTCTPRRELRSAREKDAPGPGAHNLPGLIGNGPKCGFTKEGRQENAGGLSPGPGSYEVQKDMANGPQWRLGTAQRNMRHESGTPGPGTYTCSSSLGGPKFSAAPRRDESRLVEAPGPVTYKIKSEMGKGLHYTMSSRWNDGHSVEHHAENPGPGQYSQQLPSNSPRFGFGTQPRQEQVYRRQRQPGPGEYSPDNKRKGAPTCRFGLAERSTTKSSGLPGPGSYNITTRPGGPKYTCSPRVPRINSDRDRLENPGPGEYEQPLTSPSKTASPRWGFGTSVRLSGTLSSNAPGPGTYDAHAKTFVGPKFAFARSKRRPLSKSETPGPGSQTGVITQFG
eukprot:GEMP01026749.1.p1 GENE.GEMP01026749.1~~GEMP01026749.1.p1  ORF type:complete len:438 (+),score=64.48 GEMP01026749.1:190-1503(+)